MASAVLKKTPLHDFQVAKGGKMVAYAGYHMAVSYHPNGLVPEHLHFIDNSQGFGHRDELPLG